MFDYRKKYILENTFNKSVCLEDDLNWLSSVIVWAEKRAVVLVDGVVVSDDEGVVMVALVDVVVMSVGMVVVSDEGLWCQLTGW